MHDSMKAKLSKLEERLAEIQKLLIDSETVKDMDNYTLLNKEFADLKPIVDKFDEYNSVLAAINDANEILGVVSSMAAIAALLRRYQSSFAVSVLQAAAFCFRSSRTNSRTADDRPPVRVLSISVISAATDMSQASAMPDNSSQNASSSDRLVRWPRMLTDRFFMPATGCRCAGNRQQSRHGWKSGTGQ